jgi:hypothetical protein
MTNNENIGDDVITEKEIVDILQKFPEDNREDLLQVISYYFQTGYNEGMISVYDLLVEDGIIEKEEISEDILKIQRLKFKKIEEENENVETE